LALLAIVVFRFWYAVLLCGKQRLLLDVLFIRMRAGVPGSLCLVTSGEFFFGLRFVTLAAY